MSEEEYVYCEDDDDGGDCAAPSGENETYTDSLDSPPAKRECKPCASSLKPVLMDNVRDASSCRPAVATGTGAVRSLARLMSR